MSSVTEKQAIKTELQSLKKINEKGMGFIIPSYQRPYVWSEEDVVKLFGDIKEAYQNKESQYFIGSVLSAVRDENGIYTYELIDGQQRTTTLILISIAFKAEGIKAPLSFVSVLGEQPRLSFAIRDTVRNLLGSYAGLDTMTKPGSETIKSDAYLTHLDANLTVLRQQVETLKKEDDFNLETFSDYIYNNVIWVNNTVPEKMDLNQLFSSMNTAGIQLEPVDLLKAKLLRKITTEKALYSTIWQACEHTENYFERNLRQLFPNADWNSLTYKDLQNYKPSFFQSKLADEHKRQPGKTLSQLINEASAGDIPSNVVFSELIDTQEELDDETVYCRSIISFELLLIHTLRIFSARRDWPDLEPRIKASNLMACFAVLLEQSESSIKSFIRLLWQVRYQFDTWAVKWVERDDRDDAQLRLTTLSRSLSRNNYYINRTAKELNELAQLQAVRNFTGDRSAQYWLTAYLGQLVANPNMTEQEVLSTLEQLDNQLSLTTETQKEATYKIVKGKQPSAISWKRQAVYFEKPRGTSFEHYWFQKLEYLLWKHGDKSDEKLMEYRITSKNSVEHVHPQKEEYGRRLEQNTLDAFGNLVLLSPGENSSYSNQTVIKKKADFDSKPRYDSLKLKKLFDIFEQHERRWKQTEISLHQKEMLKVLEMHYQ